MPKPTSQNNCPYNQILVDACVKHGGLAAVRDLESKLLKLQMTDAQCELTFKQYLSMAEQETAAYREFLKKREQARALRMQLLENNLPERDKALRNVQEDPRVGIEAVHSLTWRGITQYAVEAAQHASLNGRVIQLLSGVFAVLDGDEAGSTVWEAFLDREYPNADN